MSQPKVKAVWFQSSVTAPGVPGIDTRINEETARLLKLSYDPQGGLWIEKGPLLVHVPQMNIKNVLFYNEQTEAEDAKKPKVRLG